MSKARHPPRKSSTRTGGKPAAGDTPRSELSPLDPGYERPESELPELSFPNPERYEFLEAARQRRRVRIRNEAIFGGLLVLIGLGVLATVRNPAFLVLALIGAGAMVAYEMTVATLE